MTELTTPLDQGTDFAKARRRFGLWSFVFFVVLLPPWWLWGADLVAAALLPVTGLVVRLFGFTGDIQVLANGDWSLGTRLTRQGVPVDYTLTQVQLRKLLLGFPLALAFLTAPPRTLRPVRAALISVALLTVVFVLSLVCAIWGDLAASLNPALATARADTNMASTMDQPPLHPLLAQIAIVGRYVGMTIAPLIAAILLWAALNPHGRALLMDDASLKDQAED
jgi:hypothetical protein